ncbi:MULTISPECIES: ATP-binding protein [Nostocales]|uniref:Circadian input-output histidine kinase CikA n=3 Tax=Nostocales TaxID=1161 RepID=A0A0C1R9W0_9CYAN|nr:ATP-binding protein [Tolypothrix bouteillei]KAF3890724.1 response regulator [Tolypothrix bouteillei VB521301]
MAQQQVTEQLFAGKGEMAMRMRSHDWSKTSLGAVETWSQSLKTAVRIMLTSSQPMWVWWGEELLNLYNDAYRPIMGGKHPAMFARPASEVWREIWDEVGPRAESTMLNNEGTYDESLLLIMERNGYPEETYYTFSYSPIPDDRGNPGGIICANTDDTKRIIGERQLALLQELAARTADARTFDEACVLSARCLETNLYDLPFAMIYLVDLEQQRVVLAGTSGIDRNHPAVPETVHLNSDSAWSFAQVIQTQKPVRIADLVSVFGNLPTGAWNRPPHQAVVVPIAPSGETGRSGLLVAGLNPLRLFDDTYHSFINLVAGQISASIANANAYEEERKRAEALAEIDRAKTTFFSNVSHEFRTPLTLMLSPLEELTNTLNERLQPDEREQLQLIQRNGLRLQKLVNTLLDFSRIEAGRIQALYEPTDLAAFTAELVSVFRSLIERAGMTLALDCPPLSEPVYVDREMWEKIVFNLMSNAFKFTFSGSITVRLQPLGRSVELRVTDTGVGIPETELPRLFERFHRVSGTRSRTYEGSGIGLALVQQLVKLHGGTIHVTSQVDCGTTFTISLPFGSAHLPPERLRRAEGKGLEATRTLTSTALGADPYVLEASRWLPESNFGLPILDFALEDNRGEFNFSSLNKAHQSKILLVDDNADMRDYVKRLLSQYWDVETVSDGLEALEFIARQLPDLVLSDVMMPRLDGFGLLRELRTNSRTKEIPIILLSARAGEESRIEGLEAGADDYLIKPFSARELLARVESNLKLAQLRQAAAQQEQALRMEVQAAKDSLESVLTRIADQFLGLDREWRYTYVNEQVTQVTGIPRENLLGRRIWEVFPDTTETQFYTEVHRALAEQVPVQFEYFYRRWNRWFENHVYPSTNGVSIIVTEITERKQAEAALQQREAELRLITDAVPVLISFIDSEQRYRFNSQKYEEWFGQPVTAIYGKPMWEVLGDTAYERVRPYVEQVLSGEQVTYESEVAYQYGGTRYIYATYVPRFDNRGNVEGFVALVNDISNLKQVEIALRKSEERLKVAQLAAKIGAWDWDLATGSVFWSEEYYTLYGLDPSIPSTYENWLATVIESDRENADRSVREALQQQQSHLNFEFRICHPTQGIRWFGFLSQIFYNSNGKPQRAIGISIDITDRKAAETEREQLLAREQAAREQAETANRIKDEFLAVLSHELRSPLNPILGWSKLLQIGNLDAAQTTQALATIERNAKLQSELIEDLLDVSRILQGKLTLNVTAVSLTPILRAAIETVRLAAEAKLIKIETNLSANLGQILGDATRLQQIIWNLLSNAVKFTPEGGRVKVQLEPVDNQAQITVVDTGKGIPANFLPYVFDYFRQADGSTTRQFGGLGLGLAIVRHLVELHGGTICAASRGEGLGATFTVRLPLIPIQPMVEPADNLSEQALDLSGVQVLLVDDEADSRDFISFVLEQAGAKVIAATTAGEAFAAFTQSHPDAILSDIGMPDMDGYMLLQQIRALPVEQMGQIPALALTAYAGDFNQQKALQAGFQQHLAKPVEPEVLVAAIANLVKRNSL